MLPKHFSVKGEDNVFLQNIALCARVCFWDNSADDRLIYRRADDFISHCLCACKAASAFCGNISRCSSEGAMICIFYGIIFTLFQRALIVSDRDFCRNHALPAVCQVLLINLIGDFLHLCLAY